MSRKPFSKEQTFNRVIVCKKRHHVLKQEPLAVFQQLSSTVDLQQHQTRMKTLIVLLSFLFLTSKDIFICENLYFKRSVSIIFVVFLPQHEYKPRQDCEDPLILLLLPHSAAVVAGVGKRKLLPGPQARRSQGCPALSIHPSTGTSLLAVRKVMKLNYFSERLSMLKNTTRRSKFTSKM